jgi:hypothetical protein
VAIAKRFDTLVRSRIITKNLSTTIHSEQPAMVPIAIHPCASVFIRGSEIESPNTEPHACESGTGKTIHNQAHEPPRERDDEECDWIVALATRRISVNAQNQPVCAADWFSESTANANSAGFFC